MHHSSFSKYLFYSVTLLVIGFVARLLLTHDLPLTADEAHYALYATHLDWSYFDHPPMVGWLQFVAISLWGDSEVALRVMPNVLHIVTAMLLFFLALKLYPERFVVALISVLLFELSFMFQLMGIAMLPDNPLLLFTLLSIFCFDYAIRSNRWLAWFLYGLCLGAMGLSKYTAILVAFGYFLWILWYCNYLFFNLKLWFAAVIGMLLIVPVIYWNIEHDWLSFTYQLEHSNVQSQQWSWLALARAQAINLLAYGVFLFFALWTMIIVSITEACKQFYVQIIAKKAAYPIGDICTVNLQSLIAIVSIFYFFVFTYSSTKDGHYLPHWVSLVFMFATPYLAFQGVQFFTKIKHSTFVKLLSIGLISAVLIFPFALSYALLDARLGKSATYQAWRGVVGWKESAMLAKKIIQEDQELSQEATIYVANWSEASRVAWYARPFAVLPVDQRLDQFDLWFTDFDKQEDVQNQFDKKGLLLAPLNHDELDRTMNRFKRCDFLQKLSSEKKNQNFEFGLWKCLPIEKEQ